jgi:uncharacterized low-complexity protein
MSDQMKMKPLAFAVGAALAGSLAAVSTANADASPFGMSSLSAGYQLGDTAEGACGEGKCGGDKGDKGEEGSCGGDKGEEGSCGGDKGEEGSCGGDKGEEGSCGGDKGEEGSCGEGKCGGTV